MQSLKVHYGENGMIFKIKKSLKKMKKKIGKKRKMKTVVGKKGVKGMRKERIRVKIMGAKMKKNNNLIETILRLESEAAPVR